MPTSLFGSLCRWRLPLAICLVSTAAANVIVAQQLAPLPPETQAKIAAAVTHVLEQTGTPSAQVGIVEHGQVVFAAAYGDAELQPKVPATADMPYGIGSVSKQFTAAAVMVLVERGKLRLDDPVSTWFPELPHSSEITLRNLLNQVSGYSDYYTEDYLTPELAASTDSYALVKRWTSRPLDFAPGTKWQYSNTNYVLAGLIVQKVCGEPFFDFLQKNVLQPAGLTGVVNLDGPDVPAIPKGYVHFGFGPPRETPREGKGTLSGAGQLAMPIGQLMLWDTVVMHREKVLKPSSWQVLQSEFNLPDGSGTGYGMGFFLEARDSRRIIEHSGGLNGFTTLNMLYPESGTAIGVLINGDGATGAIVRTLEAIVFAPGPSVAQQQYPAAETLLRTALTQLQQGSIDRALLSPNLAFFFTPQALADYQSSLAGLGPVTKLGLIRDVKRGGMQGLVFRVTGTSGAPIRVFIYVTADGKLDQLLLSKIAPAS